MTLKELSAACGLSVSTISKALNGYADVSEETRQAVRKKAAELGYQPNAAARGLRSGRTYNLGVLYADDAESGLTHNYFSPILQAFRAEAERKGYDITFISRQFGQGDTSFLEHCRSRNFDGVFIVCCHFDRPEVQELLKSEFPLVTIDYVCQGKGCVQSDNRSGIEQIVRRVLELGHRRVAFIHGHEEAVSTTRLKGFRRAMQAAGVTIPESYIIEAEYHNPASARAAAEKLLDLPEPPTCILMPDDYAALGGMDAIRARGLRIPEDVSVIGYDGVPLLQRTSPKLTTVRQDTETIGCMAARHLVELIEEDFMTDPQIIIAPVTFLPG